MTPFDTSAFHSVPGLPNMLVRLGRNLVIVEDIADGGVSSAGVTLCDSNRTGYGGRTSNRYRIDNGICACRCLLVRNGHLIGRAVNVQFKGISNTALNGKSRLSIGVGKLIDTPLNAHQQNLMRSNVISSIRIIVAQSKHEGEVLPQAAIHEANDGRYVLAAVYVHWTVVHRRISIYRDIESNTIICIIRRLGEDVQIIPNKELRVAKLKCAVYDRSVITRGVGPTGQTGLLIQIDKNLLLFIGRVGRKCRIVIGTSRVRGGIYRAVKGEVGQNRTPLGNGCTRRAYVVLIGHCARYHLVGRNSGGNTLRSCANKCAVRVITEDRQLTRTSLGLTTALIRILTLPDLNTILDLHKSHIVSAEIRALIYSHRAITALATDRCNVSIRLTGRRNGVLLGGVPISASRRSSHDLVVIQKLNALRSIREGKKIKGVYDIVRSLELCKRAKGNVARKLCPCLVGIITDRDGYRSIGHVHVKIEVLPLGAIHAVCIIGRGLSQVPRGKDTVVYVYAKNKVVTGSSGITSSTETKQSQILRSVVDLYVKGDAEGAHTRQIVCGKC